MSCPVKCCKSSWLVGIVVLLSLAIWLFKFNQPLFYMINSRHVLLPDGVWNGINYITYPKHFILPLILLILTWLFKRDKLKQVVILLIVFYVVFYALKIMFGEARPFVVLPQHSFYWISKYENPVKNAFKSFPSGHTGLMAVFVFSLIRLFFANANVVKVLLFLLLILTGLARICTGWHWPLDVLVSGLIGYILVKICLRKCTS